ncbi:MAG: hypothetical protein QOI59_6637 [Gammaproteobacteria bacterium]|jgi:hypothetical protein|nr:hypothetical protein [Gammaproteobacteria bacterium]
MLGSKTLRGSLAGLATCGVLLLAGCGDDMGGSMGSASNTSGTPTACGSSSCGPSIVTMTDAKGDFLSYTVNLTSLQLQTAAGATVETLPSVTKVDFAQLVDLTEVISAGQIPAAEYVGATLTLDYTGANITADDGTGAAVALKPVDANGAALAAPVTVSVKLDNAHHLMITKGRTGRLAFDFNLAASNTVDLTASTVTVSPTLVATVVPSDNKQVRVRGQFASASTTANDFVLNVQPFHDQTKTNGQVTVGVGMATTYQVNGTALVGAAGLAALAALPANTMVAAFGTLQTDTQTFTATTVLAGTSLENPSKDQVSGTVIARTANTLTLRRATLWMRDGDFESEHHDVTVTVADGTAVTEQGTMGTFTITDISVGQHIDAFGTASSTSGSNSGSGMSGSDGSNKTLDASAGSVRLDMTPAWGVVTALAAGSMTVNLQSLDGLPVSAFNFAGTGTSTAMDANPMSYVIDTGLLTQTGLAVKAPARVIGFVTPFGKSPPNFTAQTLVNFSGVPEALVIDWAQRGSATAFTGLTATSTSLQLDLAGVDKLHFIQMGPQTIDLTSLATAPTITADATATNEVFAIGHRGKYKTENFNTFAAFITALAADLTPTATVVDLAATGQYDSTANTFTATRLAVLIND